MALVAVCGFIRTASAELVGYWSFDEGSGAIAKDGSGNGNDGTLENGPEWTAGQSGDAVQFDGTDDYVNVGNADTLSITGNLTFSLWVKISEYPTSWRNMLSKLVDDTHTEFNFRYKNSTEAQFYYGTGSAAIICMWNPSEDLPLDTWTHIAGVRKSNAYLKLYFNGVEKRTSNITTDAVSTEANVTIGRQSNAIFYFDGIIDEVAIFTEALGEAGIQSAMSGVGHRELASKPNPAHAVVDVPRDTALGWSPGEFAVKHNVYLGTTFDDVNNADIDAPLDVLVSQGQDANTLDPVGVFTLGQTYYWRVDEVNGAPDNTIYKGEVWSFTVEPVSYAIEGVVATSNGTPDVDADPENAVNGSGLNADDQHSVESSDMWLASPVGDDPLTVTFEFDRIYKMHEMLVWNYNVAFELLLGFGVKDATVEYSTDGAEWVTLGDVALAQATAKSDYAVPTTVDLQGVPAQYVRLVVNSAHGTVGKFGLSEVRFMQIAAHARQPQPADGAADVAVIDAALSWRAGREAVTHEVYLSTDPDALERIDTTGATAVDPGALDLATTVVGTA